MSNEEKPPLDYSPLAFMALKGLTPILLAVLVFIGTRTIDSLDKLVETVHNMQITQAKEQQINESERTANALRYADTMRRLGDQEERMRKVEARRCKTCPLGT